MKVNPAHKELTCPMYPPNQHLSESLLCADPYLHCRMLSLNLESRPWCPQTKVLHLMAKLLTFNICKQGGHAVFPLIKASSDFPECILDQTTAFQLSVTDQYFYPCFTADVCLMICWSEEGVSSEKGNSFHVHGTLGLIRLSSPILSIIIPLNCHKSLAQSKDCYRPHSTDERTESQQGGGIQGHTASVWWNESSKPCFLTPQSCPLFPTPYHLPRIQ